MLSAARGELWLIDPGTPLGHEQGFTRPAVVVSHDGLELEAGAGTGLSDTSCAQAEQVRAVTSNRLVRRLGAVDLVTLAAIEQAVRRMLAL